MAFKKANPEQGKLKVSMYGPPGSGKTFSALLFAEGIAKHYGKRIAYVDTERGTDFYAQAVKDRKVHPTAFDFDAIYTRSLSEVLSNIKALDQSYGVLVVDSISHIWEAAQEAYTGKRTKIDTLPMHAWGKIKKPYKDLIRFLMDCPFHVFILGRQKNVFEVDEDTNDTKKIGVEMRAEGETAYEPHICLRFESRKTNKDGTKSDVLMFAEKDRTGVLDGRMLKDPTYDAVIYPLLPLLGEKQAQSENEEERIAKDSELMSDDTKEKAKEAKSKGFFDKFLGELQSASALSDLGLVAEDIKKHKRYLLEQHENTLREIYKSQRDKLVEQTAKDI
jgi:hypothetical protein